METEELLAIIANGEDSRHQFKATINNENSLASEMAAFCNAKGGYCVLGAANNQLADNDIEQKLFNEGIIYCPDYCVNAGGVTILPLRSSIKEDMEYDEPEAKTKLTGIKDQLKNILLLSKNKSQLSTVSSNELAEQGFQ